MNRRRFLRLAAMAPVAAPVVAMGAAEAQSSGWKVYAGPVHSAPLLAPTSAEHMAEIDKRLREFTREQMHRERQAWRT